MALEFSFRSASYCIPKLDRRIVGVPYRSELRAVGRKCDTKCFVDLRATDTSSSFPVDAFQSRIVASSPVLAISFPFGEKTTSLISIWSVGNLSVCFQVATSHTWMMASSPEVARSPVRRIMHVVQPFFETWIVWPGPRQRCLSQVDSNPGNSSFPVLGTWRSSKLSACRRSPSLIA